MAVQAETGAKAGKKARAGASAEGDLRMAKALAHPLRVQVLAILDQRIASPNEMAKEIGVPVSKLSYHVNELKKYGCIELDSTAQRRGATEHFYRATMRPYFNDRDWSKVPRTGRQGISSSILQMVVDDSVEALDAGTFDARTDRHMSRTPLSLDEEGWTELHDLLKVTLERSLDIQSKAAGRMERDGTKGIPSKLAMLHFESPEPDAKG